MVRITVQQVYAPGKVYIEGTCNTGDTMPKQVDGMDVIGGSQLFEMDAAKPYMFSEAIDDWIELGAEPAAQGGDE